MDDEPDVLDLVLALAASEVADPGLVGIQARIQRLCRAAVKVLGLVGAAVHVMADPPQDLVAGVAGSHGRLAADLTFSTGEGPARDSFAARRPVLAADLAAGLERWPGYVSQALELGVCAAYAFPLQIGATCFGVLDLFADRAAALDAEQIAIGLSFAQAATLILLDSAHIDETDIDGQGDTDLGRGLAEALDQRPEVHQAQGMVMIDLRVSLSDALLRMRARAFASEIALIELSRLIINGDEDPRAWDSDPDGDPDGAPGLDFGAGG